LGWRQKRFCRKISGSVMAREVALNGRKYWILSEPQGESWKAKVVEVGQGDELEELGIDATAETRVAADDAAEGKLRRLLRDLTP
jgi:hypothetical protein